MSTTLPVYRDKFPSPTGESFYYVFVLLFWFSALILPRPFLNLHEVPLLSKLRFEDMLVPIWLAYLLVRWRSFRKIAGRFALVAMVLWASYAWTVSLLNAVGRGYPVWAGAAFAAKELEYLLIVGALSVFAARNGKRAMTGIVVASLPVYAVALWQVRNARYLGYYGLAFPFEIDAPATIEAGVISALLFVVLYAVALNARSVRLFGSPFRRLGLYLVVGVTFVMFLLTLSRSGIIGGISAAVLLTARRLLLPGGRAIRVVPALLGLVLGAVVLSGSPLSDKLVSRFVLMFDYAIADRFEGWSAVLAVQLDGFVQDPFAVAAGLGLGSPGFLLPERFHGLTLGVDNQFVRRMFEVGVVGSSLWLLVLLAIGRRTVSCARKSTSSGLFRDLTYGLFCTVLVASLGGEVLQVARIGAVFYGLAGSLLGLSYSASLSEARGSVRS